MSFIYVFHFLQILFYATPDSVANQEIADIVSTNHAFHLAATVNGNTVRFASRQSMVQQ